MDTDNHHLLGRRTLALPAMSAETQPAPDLLTPPIDQSRLPEAIEALLLTSDRPLGPAKLAQALGLESGKPAARTITEAVNELNTIYKDTGRCFRIETVAGGYRAVALAHAAPILAALHGINASSTLSRAAIETLSIIAYRQPVTRAEIEAIRGVSSGEIVRSLLDKRLVDIAGRADEPGRPMLYGTTRFFLDSFGLASIKDLPPVDAHPPLDEEPTPDKPAQEAQAAHTSANGDDT